MGFGHGVDVMKSIATRPGVVSDGEAQGLFGEDGVPDLAGVTGELAALTQASVYRMLVTKSGSLGSGAL